MKKLYMYVSQWAFILGQPGLSLYTFDPDTGEIAFVRQLNDSLSLGCSMVDQKRKLLYLCNECDIFPEVPYNTGRVYCFAIDPATGDLTLKSRKETLCPFTSYLNTDPDGRYLVVSNHSMNNYATTVEQDEHGSFFPVLHHHDSLMNLFRLEEDGSIGEMLDIAKHRAPRQMRFSLLGKPAIPHPHSVMRSPSGKLYACCDKGDGHLYLYAIEGEKLRLLSRTLTDMPGSEPRHCAFHPTLPYLFVNHEHTPGDNITLTTFRYGEDGTMEKVAVFHADVSSYQPKEKHRQQQGMRLSPDGRFLYTQVHGYNLLLTLAVNEENGTLTQVQETPIAGIWPRSLNFSPDGNYLVCCCLEGQIIVYRVGENGLLEDTGHHGFVKGAGGVSFFDPNA